MKQKFYEKIYAIARKIPRGKVTTYKALASLAGSRAYRAVGTAMNKNPYSVKKKNQIHVACHRVINSDGRVGGFASGTKKKIAMLRKEGVEVKNNRVNLQKFGWRL